MKMKKHSRWLRVLIGILSPLLCAAALWSVYLHGSPGECYFHRFTSLYCPGCGSGRALYALLHGQLSEAIRYNGLFLLLGIPAGAVLSYEYLRFVFPRPRLKPVRVPYPISIGCLVLLLVFSILRNIPAFGFLAP